MDNTLKQSCVTNQASDTFCPAFGELYDHRCVLFLALIASLGGGWYSNTNSDGSAVDGFFIAGIGLPEPISYTLPNKFLYLVKDSKSIHFIERVPQWHENTSDNVLAILLTWVAVKADK
jgi:hypothetical protein